MTPECQKIAPRLGPYRDGEMAAADKGAVEAHLAACDACGARLADLQVLGGLLKLRADALGEELPAGFAARVMAALPPERVSWLHELFGHRKGLVLGMLAAAAAVAAVALPLVVRPPAGRDRDATENEAHVHRLTISGPPAKPLVFKDDLGETVVWVVPDPGAPGATAGQEAPAGAHP